jgi:hypothetical protein
VLGHCTHCVTRSVVVWVEFCVEAGKVLQKLGQLLVRIAWTPTAKLEEEWPYWVTGKIVFWVTLCVEAGKVLQKLC